MFVNVLMIVLKMFLHLIFSIWCIHLLFSIPTTSRENPYFHDFLQYIQSKLSSPFLDLGYMLLACS